MSLYIRFLSDFFVYCSILFYNSDDAAAGQNAYVDNIILPYYTIVTFGAGGYISIATTTFRNLTYAPLERLVRSR